MMNNMKRYFVIVLFASMWFTTYGGLVQRLADTKLINSSKFFVDVQAEKEKQLKELQNELATLTKSEKAVSEELNRHIEETKNLIILVEREFTKDPDDDYLNKKLAILKETYQVLKETQRAREELISFITNFIKELKKFLDDPDFSKFKKEYKLQERLYYSFEDLQKLHETILDHEGLVAQLVDREKNVRAEHESRKHTIAANKQEYEKRKQKLREIASIPVENFGFGMDVQQETDLLELEEQLYRLKETLNEIQLKEVTYRISFVELQLFIAKAQLDMLKDHLRAIKPSIRVSEADVVFAKDELIKEQQEYFSRKEMIRQEREKASKQKKAREKELILLAKRLNIELGREVEEWSKEPKSTMPSYLSLAQVGVLNSYLLALNKEIELLDAQIALEDEKLNYQSLRTKSKETYYKIAGRKFVSEEDITQERKKYETQKEKAKALRLVYREKINAIANLLNLLKKVLDNIKDLRQDAREKKAIIFKANIREYNRFEEFLNRAEGYVKKQIDTLSKLTGVYSAIISEINSAIRLIDFVVGELQSSTIWYRPEFAITWQGVKNIIPDALAFLKDIRLYIMRFNPGTFIGNIKEFVSNPFKIFVLTSKLLVCIIGLLLLRWYQQTITDLFFSRSLKYGGLLRVIGFLCAAILRFISMHVVGVILWIIGWLLLQIVPDPYLYILFYLLSIPYLLYFSYRFMRFIMQLNRQYNYILLAQDFQRRFYLIISTLLYATIIIFFFRQAFMLSSYYRSELPRILLAVHFIICQIALIFLITKEQILSIISQKTDFWRWVRLQVDTYYYLLLIFVIAIIVMSNPYVGFGRLLLYLLFSLVYTALFVKGLMWVYDIFKRAVSYIFFVSDDSVIRERFTYAKTWFGLLIVASFLIFGFIGFIVIAKIWGWPIGFNDIIGLLNTELLQKGTKHPITTLSLLEIIGFVLAGFVIAYALNKFVLDKIFDLLLVDTGVQHTVTRLIQYCVIIIAVFIGFQSVGLGQLIGVLIGALAVGIGFYIKDPISDLVAYFIILVQRPIKIGDYVKIDLDTAGVVRKITARSVIIRKKNSSTLVVPNSYVISRSIENWNYVRNFIAFNDINLTVIYKSDPLQTKEILLHVVESHPNVLKNPKPIIRLDEFSESGYVFMVRGFVSSAYTLDQWNIASDIRFSMVKALREKGIELAVPMRRIIDVYGSKEDPYTKDEKE